ncbi:MAG: hypothetical protein WC027_00820 [Candidatus Paceibacterota bacterium]
MKNNKMFKYLILLVTVFPIKLLALDYQPLEGDVFADFTTSGTSSDLALFLAGAFQFGLALAAALAVVMIVWGGVEIMLSESLFKKEDGKKKVWDAVWGLLLALVSWLILYTINPAILDWSAVSTPDAEYIQNLDSEQQNANDLDMSVSGG